MGDDVTPLWQSMTPAERTAAYSPSSMIGGNLAPFIQAYTVQSAAAYAANPSFQALAYGDRPSQTIDLVVPQSDEPVPLHFFVHGGYWQQLSKKESTFGAPDTLAQGIAFAAVDYTLAPHATLEHIVIEVTTALRHLRAQAPSFGIDPARIIVSGSSAGAHLAAMATLALPPSEQPAGLILLSGIYDLRPLVDIYVNDALGMDMAAAKRNSPALQDLSHFPPTLIGWGGIETDEFKRQSRHFAQLLDRAGNVVETLEMPARNHFDIVHDLANDTALGQWLPRLAKAKAP